MWEYETIAASTATTADSRGHRPGDHRVAVGHPQAPRDLGRWRDGWRRVLAERRDKRQQSRAGLRPVVLAAGGWRLRLHQRPCRLELGIGAAAPDRGKLLLRLWRSGIRQHAAHRVGQRGNPVLRHG